MAQTFQRKVEPVQAVQWQFFGVFEGGTTYEAIQKLAGDKVWLEGSTLVLSSGGLEEQLELGDWVVREADGRLVGLTNEDFRKLYEPMAAPASPTPAELAAEPIMQFFEYRHLPAHLQEVSRMFGETAHQVLASLPRNAERSTALRKLLEGKDAAVRARLARDPLADSRREIAASRGMGGPMPDPASVEWRNLEHSRGNDPDRGGHPE